MRFSRSVVGPPISAGNRPPVAVKPSGEPLPPHLELARQLDGLPKDLGTSLLLLGTFGVAIPGPIPPGVSFILLGAVVLRPCMLVCAGGPLARRFPKAFYVLISLATHFRVDLARRYPGSVSPPRELSRDGNTPGIAGRGNSVHWY